MIAANRATPYRASVSAYGVELYICSGKAFLAPPNNESPGGFPGRGFRLLRLEVHAGGELRSTASRLADDAGHHAGTITHRARVHHLAIQVAVAGEYLPLVGQPAAGR